MFGNPNHVCRCLQLMTRECGEAIVQEIGALARSQSRLVDWTLKPGWRARILQHRVLPNPQTQQTFYQVF